MTTVHHLADGTRIVVRPLLCSDGATVTGEQFGWTVSALDEPDQPGIGSARFVRMPTRPTAAEVVVTVLDDYRRKGIGTLVLAKLLGAARPRGIDTFVAYVPTQNTAVLDHLWNIGARTLFHEEGITRVEFPLPPTDRDAEALTRRALHYLTADDPG